MCKTIKLCRFIATFIIMAKMFSLIWHPVIVHNAAVESEAILFDSCASWLDGYTHHLIKNSGSLC